MKSWLWVSLKVIYYNRSPIWQRSHISFHLSRDSLSPQPLCFFFLSPPLSIIITTHNFQRNPENLPKMAWAINRSSSFSLSSSSSLSSLYIRRYFCLSPKYRWIWLPKSQLNQIKIDKIKFNWRIIVTNRTQSRKHHTSSFFFLKNIFPLLKFIPN